MLYVKVFSLVIQHDVWEPDVCGGDMEAVHSPVLLGVPPELVIKPILLDPEVGRHNLLAEILKGKHCGDNLRLTGCCTHHINQLGELELELDGDSVGDVHDGSDELVVGGEQVIKQALGIRVS